MKQLLKSAGALSVVCGLAAGISAVWAHHSTTMFDHSKTLTVDGDRWRATEMTADAAGSFRLALPSVSAPFKYRVAAGAVTSPTYEIAVAVPPA